MLLGMLFLVAFIIFSPGLGRAVVALLVVLGLIVLTKLTEQKPIAGPAMASAPTTQVQSGQALSAQRIAIEPPMDITPTAPVSAESEDSSLKMIRESMSRLPGQWVGRVPGGNLDTSMFPYRDEDVANIPDFDIDEICQRNFGGYEFLACLNSERRNYDLANSVWNNVSLATKKVCTAITIARSQQEARINGLPFPRNYAVLEDCLKSRYVVELTLRQKGF